MNYCPICGSNEINTSGYCWMHQHKIRSYPYYPEKTKKKLWGLFRELELEEKDIEEIKKILFPNREF